LKRGLASALAAIAGVCAAALLSASALGISIHGPVSVELDGKTSRTKFAARMPKPITMTLEGRFSEPAGTGARVPAVTTISVQFDKAGAIFTKGLPTCRPPSTASEFWWSLCKKALVGQGHVELEIQFPDQPPFRGGGHLLIFNSAPQGGRPTLLYYLYAKVPAPTTFFTYGVIEPGHGRYGTQTTIKIPTITSGQGSVVGFRAKIGRTWTYKGQKVSLLTASCPNGRLFAHADFDFISGSQASGELAKQCAETGQQRLATSHGRT
jgi:hypothetical protein